MMRVFVCELLSGSGVPGHEAELLEAGLAMRDAIVSDLLAAGDCAVSVAVGIAPAAVPDGATPVPVPAGASVLEVLGAAAARHDRTWVVAPETEGALAASLRAVGEHRWIGCTAAAIALASSKRATLARAAAHGLRTPLAVAGAKRWVVKPDDGAGAMRTTLHATRRAAEADAAERDEPVSLEPWIDGEPLSLSLLCGGNDVAELLSVNRQRIGVDAAGEVSFDGVDIDVLAPRAPRRVALQAWARAIAGAIPGLRGYVGVDLVWGADDRPVLIEVNPRVTMAYPGLSTALGRNLAAEILALPIPEPAHVRA